MKASEFMKKYEKQRAEDKGNEEEDHSLEHNARERAAHLDGLNVGSPYDWEDLESYKKELERMEREGPGKGKSSDE